MDYSAMEALMERRITDLRNTSIADLRTLPECREELVELDGTKVQLFTIHEVVNDKHRVVVQAARRRWGGIAAKVMARGFEIENDQTMRTLSPEELYDFT
jgi:hypothetical protein